LKQVLATVRENREIAEGTYRMRLRAPEIAAHAKAGQFVHVRPGPVGESGIFSFDPLLRRPLSLLRAERTTGEVEILYDVVGRGTALLARARVADELDVLGPLGRPFELAPKTRHALLVGGGIGVVPLLMLAEAALAAGASAGKDVAVTLLAGYRTAAKAFPTDLIPPEVEYVVATDDGTLGRPGFVTEAVSEYLLWADQVFACGPLPMLKALGRLEIPRSLPVQISMEEHMGCAMGVCLGCVVETKHGLKRVCRDGPVFSLREMVW
jgi:dihydroorotate dehydrogenase electron transfer subunit